MANELITKQISVSQVDATINNPVLINENFGFLLKEESYHDIAVIDITDPEGLSNRFKSGINPLINSVTTQAYISVEKNLSVDIVDKNNRKIFSIGACHIHFDIDFNFNFKLFGLENPGINTTLYRKLDMISREIALLNDTLIHLIQDLNCCNMSKAYNETMVPLFRFFADNPEVRNCREDQKDSEGNCHYGGGENVFSIVAKIVQYITQAYTIIQPIFCLIKPIPGNPWMPMSFDWWKAFRDKFEKYEEAVDKFMSGWWLDTFNQFIISTRRKINECSRTHPLQLKEKNFNEGELKILAHQTQNINRELKKHKAQNKYSNNLKTLNNEDIKKLTFLDIKNANTGICGCIENLLDIRLRVPKFPSAKIYYIPPTNDEKTFTKYNSLYNILDEEAYTITFRDLFNPQNTSSKILNTFYTIEQQDKHITFTKENLSNNSFRNAFFKYIDKDKFNDGNSSITLSGLDFVKALEYIKNDNNLTEDDFHFGIIDNLKMYFLNNSDIEQALKNSKYDFAKLIKHEKINKAERANTFVWENIYKPIRQFIKIEDAYTKRIEDINIKIYNKYLNSKNTILKNIKLAQRNLENKYAKNLITKDTYTQEKAFLDSVSYNLQLAISEYIKYDFIADPLDIRLNKKIEDFIAFGCGSMDPNLNEAINNYLDYVKFRKSLIGNIAIKEFNKIAKNASDKRNKYLNAVHAFSKEIDNINKKRKKPLTINEVIALLQGNTSEGNNLRNISEKLLNLDENNYMQAARNYLNFDRTTIIKDGTLINNVYYIPSLAVGQPNGFTLDSIFDNKNWAKDLTQSIMSNYNSNLINGIESNSEINIQKWLFRIFKIEKIKEDLLILGEDQYWYDFYLAYYPDRDCTCDIICKIIQYIVNILLAYLKYWIKKFLKWLIDYLIPDWLKNIIRLIMYKLKCILEAIYIPENLKEAKDLYSFLLNMVRDRIALYPEDNCVLNAIDEAISNENNSNSTSSNSTGLNNGLNNGDSSNKKNFLSILFENKSYQMISNFEEKRDVIIKLKFSKASSILYFYVNVLDKNNNLIRKYNLTNTLNTFLKNGETNPNSKFYYTKATESDNIIVYVRNLDYSQIQTGGDSFQVEISNYYPGSNKPVLYKKAKCIYTKEGQYSKTVPVEISLYNIINNSYYEIFPIKEGKINYKTLGVKITLPDNLSKIKNIKYNFKTVDKNFKPISDYTMVFDFITSDFNKDLTQKGTYYRKIQDGGIDISNLYKAGYYILGTIYFQDNKGNNYKATDTIIMTAPVDSSKIVNKTTAIIQSGLEFSESISYKVHDVSADHDQETFDPNLEFVKNLANDDKTIVYDCTTSAGFLPQLIENYKSLWIDS